MPFAMTLAFFMMLGGEAVAAAVIKTDCKKNLDDGRILIKDFSVLPADDSTFRVLRYKAGREDGGWSEGPCTIQVTGHAR